VHLFVTGCGFGLPKAAHGRRFEMFQRYHSDRTYEGTGSGLTIVRKATERIGGQVSLELEPGKGRTLRVRLPQA
jgi:light-regulated signal transduction histidine kinase (bacteriophytochrome)